MNKVGITKDGVHVVDGVFRLMDTIGLPLDIICQELKDRNLMPAWDYFILDAKNAGWKRKTILRKLAECDVTLPEVLLSESAI